MLQPGFMVLHANRLEALRDVVLAWLAQTPLPPLVNEQILVQSNGMAQWLQHSLAQDDIAMGLETVLPARMQWRIYRTVLGNLPTTSPFERETLHWALFSLLHDDTLLNQREFALLRQFLAGSTARERKRNQLAAELAGLYDQYQVYRADWLEHWRAGRDVLDGNHPLPEAMRWQPVVWRKLCEAQPDALDRGRIHSACMQRLEQWQQHGAPSATGLPPRIVVFGITSLPQQLLELLAAVAHFSQIILCVHNPCRHYWGDIIDGREYFKRPYQRHQTAPDHTASHPLLAAWGRQGRDYLRLLDAHDERSRYEALFQSNQLAIDQFDDALATATTGLLSQLQDDILNLRPVAESRRLWPEPASDDDSIAFHICHSPQREVEVLHDQLLAALEHDPTLQPRDIMVMVPDIDTYAPHVRAVFGSAAAQTALPYTLADLGQRQRQPLLIALEGLLQLPESRLGASELFAWLEVPALRRRFGLDEDDLPVVQRWLDQAAIRWGLHREHRASLGLDTAGELNSWRFGLDRLLLGYALGEDAHWQDIEACGSVGGLEAALLGPLSTLVQALDTWRTTLTETAEPAQWTARLNQLLDTFFLPEDDAEQALCLQLQAWLETWQDHCEQVGFQHPLPIEVVREHWLDALDQRRLNRRFIAGAVHFSTLMPMRAVPFRHIYLLGMNDGDFPRQQQPATFDLMSTPGHYRPGDRSRREDDRYLMLEALLSARDRLVISWVGRNIHDDSTLPPSVLVGQLRDHLLKGWQHSENGLQARTTQHPMQPFSARYFSADNSLFSYAHHWRKTLEPTAKAQAESLPPWPQQTPVGLDALRRLLHDPVGLLFNLRLNTHAVVETLHPLVDHERFALDGRERWQLRHDLLRQGAQVENPDQALQAQLMRWQRSGMLSHAGFGPLMQHNLLQGLDEQLARYAEARGDHAPTPHSATHVQLACDQEEGVSLHDRIDALYQQRCGDQLRIVLHDGSLFDKNKIRGNKLLAYWPTHLAAQCLAATTTVLVGEDGNHNLTALHPDIATQHLHTLLHWYTLALQHPLPVAPKTALAWLSANEGNSEAEARKAYEGDDYNPAERDQYPFLKRCYADFDCLMTGTGAITFVDCVEALYRPFHQHIATKASA